MTITKPHNEKNAKLLHVLTLLLNAAAFAGLFLLPVFDTDWPAWIPGEGVSALSCFLHAVETFGQWNLEELLPSGKFFAYFLFGLYGLIWIITVLVELVTLFSKQAKKRYSSLQSVAEAVSIMVGMLPVLYVICNYCNIFYVRAIILPESGLRPAAGAYVVLACMAAKVILHVVFSLRMTMTERQKGYVLHASWTAVLEAIGWAAATVAGLAFVDHLTYLWAEQIAAEADLLRFILVLGFFPSTGPTSIILYVLLLLVIICAFFGTSAADNALFIKRRGGTRGGVGGMVTAAVFVLIPAAADVIASTRHDVDLQTSTLLLAVAGLGMILAARIVFHVKLSPMGKDEDIKVLYLYDAEVMEEKAAKEAAKAAEATASDDAAAREKLKAELKAEILQEMQGEGTDEKKGS